VPEDKLDLWLISGAERFRRDMDWHEALVTIARHEDSPYVPCPARAIIDNPGYAERLLQVLKRRRKEGMQNDLGDFYLICFFLGFVLSVLLLWEFASAPAAFRFPHRRGSRACSHAGGGHAGELRRSTSAPCGVSRLVRRHGLLIAGFLPSGSCWFLHRLRERARRRGDRVFFPR